MSLIQVGLVDTTGALNPDLVQAVAAALNTQVVHDLPQYWNLQATVRYLPHAAKIPAGVWPVRLVKSLPPGEGGFHMDKHNQPYAKVIATPANDEWTIAASHETIEMIVDPYGNKLQSSRAIKIDNGKILDGDGEFGYLVEACDPCEADEYAYSIQGIAVSDFLTPHYYDATVSADARYSFKGHIKAPRQILPGGYISWVNTAEDRVQQLQYLDPNSPPKIVDLGPASGLSLREWVDNHTIDARTKHHKPNDSLMKRCKLHFAELEKIALVKAKLYQAG
jgi:hypothetical protein